MLRRGRTHSGTCAIAVASLVCGLHAASLPLAAQTLPRFADQPQTKTDGDAGFEERFSPGVRAQPLFTHPDVQRLIASLPPPSTNAVGPSVAGAEPEPQPSESTASVEVRKAGPESAAAASGAQTEPDLPLPPYPPNIVVASKHPSSEAAETVPPPPAHVPEKPAVKHGSQRNRVRRQTARSMDVVVTSSIRRGSEKPETTAPTTNSALSSCPAGTSCVSQQQTMAIFFGFLAGALLGGPVGALAGGALGAAATAEAPRGTGASHAARP